VSTDDDAGLLPSRNRELLAGLVGRAITRLTECLAEPLDEILASPSFSDLPPARRFSRLGGSVIVSVDGGRMVCVGSSEEMASITVEAADESYLDEELGPMIDATDPVQSEPGFAGMIGRAIERIRVLRFDLREDRLEFPTRTGKRIFFPRALDLPREAALIMELHGGGGLLFSASFLSSPAHFAVFPAAELADAEVPWVEVLRTP
jgi:hypothetical protein